MDIEESYMRIAAEYTNGSSNIIFLTGDASADRWHTFRSNKIDAVVIDADHTYEAALPVSSRSELEQFHSYYSYQ